jgi:hypothetical protein
MSTHDSDCVVTAAPVVEKRQQFAMVSSKAGLTDALQSMQP